MDRCITVALMDTHRQEEAKDITIPRIGLIATTAFVHIVDI